MGFVASSASAAALVATLPVAWTRKAEPVLAYAIICDFLDSAQFRTCSLIDELARLRVFSITVSGGEPLVRKDLFELLQHMTDRNLCARLSTNGYAVTRDTLRRLENLNVFAVQVSVDGLRGTHDFLRNHVGSYQRAIDALSMFAQAGFYTLMTTTANSSNLDEIPVLFDIAVELGVSAFKVGPCIPLGRATANASTLAISHEQIKGRASILHSRKRELEDRIVMLIDGLFPRLLERPPSERCAPQFDRHGPGCSAGISQVLVSYDGNVFPCPYIRSRSAGNIRDASLLEIWNNDAVLGPLRRFDQEKIKGKCGDCPYHLTMCNGGCGGWRWWVTAISTPKIHIAGVGFRLAPHSLAP